MDSLPIHLNPREKQAFLAFSSCLAGLLVDNLVEIWLFGSKARGDFGRDSDIDVLVIVNESDPDVRWMIQTAGADISLKYDVLFNTHIHDKERWGKMVRYQDTYWREIQRDGIPLFQPAPDSLPS